MATNPYPLPLAVTERAMHEFCNLWLAGLEPQLYLETSPDGNIHVRTGVAAKCVLPERPNLPLHHRYQPRHKTRSQIRRKERRARARAAARSSTVQDDKSTQTMKQSFCLMLPDKLIPL